jgi:hypothetical protein
VLYAALAVASPHGSTAEPLLRTCLAECFVERGVVELTRDAPYFTLFRLAAPIRLLDIADSDWVARAGGNGAIASGLRSTARDWARAIYRHYTGSNAVDGIVYTCSIIPSARSVVLWERAAPALPARPSFTRPLVDGALRAEIESYCTELHLELVP